MSSMMPQVGVGQLSPDTQWYWDGTRWMAAISPDGYWRWNGTAWQPASQPTPVAPGTYGLPQRTFASPVTRSMLVLIALGVLGFGYLLEVVGDTLALAGLKGANANQLGAADVVQGLAGLIVLAAFIATVVLFCRWVHRVHQNLAALGATGLRFTSGWAVGWWFVPIASLWKPYQVMREIWVHSAPTGQAWGLLKVWWALWLISNYLDNVGFRLSFRGQWPDLLDIVSTVLDLIALGLAAMVIRQITAWQLVRSRA